MSFFKLVRVTVLLTILVIVTGTQWLSARKLNGWAKPAWVTVYPVVAAEAEAALPYAQSLKAPDFDEINRFLAREAGRYGRALDAPLVFQVSPTVRMTPPAVPQAGSRLATALWSLKMRWWAWRRDREDGLPSGDLQIFLVLNPAGGVAGLDRSVGFRKGQFGVVNVFGDRSMSAVNRVVIAHELLHLFGATDKYDPLTGQPLAPQGLGNPLQQPLYPQVEAEIMGGRVATTARQSKIPRSLKSCRVGETTALEIGWGQAL